jgi:hypothetical protein
MTLSELDDAMESAVREVKAIKAKLKAEIRRLPDNPRIKRINASCYTISVGDLGASWSASYNDFKYQYEAIAEEIDVRPPEKVASMIEQIIRDGQIMPSAGTKARRQYGGGPFRFHPDVVEKLRNL